MRVVFFFQAEDGIRDVAVTGVQTCALPISNNERVGILIPKAKVALPSVERRIRICDDDDRLLGLELRKHIRLCGDRSEERRVGKEWRSRCSPAAGNRRSCSVRG